MKRILIILVWIVVAIAVVAGLLLSYREMSREREAEDQSENPVAVAVELSRTPEGEVILTLAQAAQTRLGLVVESPAITRQTPEITVAGQVLDPAPLLALVADLELTRQNLQLAQTELQRAKTLQGQGNISVRALETAQVAVRREELRLRTLHLDLRSRYGNEFADRGDFLQLIENLINRNAVLVRLDVPAGVSLPETPAKIHVSPAFGSATNALPAERVGLAPAVHPQTQGIGWLFLVQGPAQVLMPGMAVAAQLPGPGQQLEGIVVPRAAVVYYGFQTWFYEQREPEKFIRRRLDLTHPMADGWLLEGGGAGIKVVVRGSQALLSEEQKKSITMPD